MALDRWIALVLLGVCLTYGYAAWFTMDGNLAPFMKRNPIWPSTFPKVLSVLGMALCLLVTAGGSPRTAIWLLAVLAFSFSMMVGAMWELLEFAIDFFFGTNAQRSGLPDTMGDTIANLLDDTSALMS